MLSKPLEGPAKQMLLSPRPRSWDITAKPLHQRQIEATDEQIDALVYELYGLTEEEIRIVEGNAG
jgi:hypothetical protein